MNAKHPYVVGGRKMGIAKKVKTILSETFAAPTSDSYIVDTENGPIILRQKGNFAGIDLSNTNLAGLDLRGINLEGAKLINVDLTGTNLSKANLSNANLSGAILSNTHLEDARTRGIVTRDVTFGSPPFGVDVGILNTGGGDSVE
jgi:hypothetical protein